MPQRFQWFMKQIIFNISAVWSPLPARCKLSYRINSSKGMSHDIKWSSSWYYPYLLWSRTVPVGDDSACMRWASITSTGYLSLSPRWMISFDTKTVGILNNVKFMKLQVVFHVSHEICADFIDELREINSNEILKVNICQISNSNFDPSLQ